MGAIAYAPAETISVESLAGALYRTPPCKWAIKNAILHQRSIVDKDCEKTRRVKRYAKRRTNFTQEISAKRH